MQSQCCHFYYKNYHYEHNRSYKPLIYIYFSSVAVLLADVNPFHLVALNMQTSDRQTSDS